MAQIYEVFFNNRPALFTDIPDTGRNAGLVFQYTGRKELLKILRLFEKYENLPSLTVYSSDFKGLKKALKSCFRVIKAAGGLVRNEHGDILFIYRRGMWDLPKGKVERFENYEKASLREVQEECGLKNLKPGPRITETFHVYRLNGKPILKKTVWYEMTADSRETLHPQHQEEITEVRWIPSASVKEIASQSFENILRVLKAGKILNSSI